ncbi:neuropeptide F-like [Teleopsis dalmanni]|uniref:neuropeptide F-like n=1 Tax=Teleopsis dalmanni TaxID=139649 RepID=UPI0018CF8383|nr:neuropeptide F-like [Teleopsis dalmanni]XP_037954299.1 neuropeptide F-like [Teleopsis dalmanni]
MNSTMRYGLVLLIALAMLTANIAAANSRPPRNNDISNMADALKYLQDLDSYYGDRARVRFGKRTSLIQLLRSHLLDNSEMAHAAELPAAEEPF